MNTETVQLALEAVNVLVLPTLIFVGRWLVKVELRLAKLEWRNEETGART